MTDLTKKYLNGNLHDGDEYYIENKDGEISTMHLYNDTIHWHSFKVKKLKVLAPVPSYEECQNLLSDQLAKNEGEEIVAELEAENSKLKTEYEKECHRADELEDSYWKAEKENQKLKELLKRCYSFIDWCELGVPVAQRPILMKDINKALGEE